MDDARRDLVERVASAFRVPERLVDAEYDGPVADPPFCPFDAGACTNGCTGRARACVDGP